MKTDLPEGFLPFVEALKAHIRDAQLRAALAVNRTLLTLDWNIGRAIPVGGFSRPNIHQMRAFYAAFPRENSGPEIVAQAVRQFDQHLPESVLDLTPHSPLPVERGAAGAPEAPPFDPDLAAPGAPSLDRERGRAAAGGEVGKEKDP